MIQGRLRGMGDTDNLRAVDVALGRITDLQTILRIAGSFRGSRFGETALALELQGQCSNTGVFDSPLGSTLHREQTVLKLNFVTYGQASCLHPQPTFSTGARLPNARYQDMFMWQRIVCSVLDGASVELLGCL
ncbi:unnamed protein product [Schistocephalus solidus]|uniref:Uncharacterized protein n=1 Tax=Schistocephalus solidus TaxID=70667 RepID=A0A183S8V3_SCHSO|nr:unnamed protein product [Schistocephalus solidus]